MNMKVQIRQGVFETNSSSEHSIAIVGTGDFQAWKEGRMYARQLSESDECKETWGNFWSELEYWEFKKMTPEELEIENRKLFDEYIQKEKMYIDLAWRHWEEVKGWKVGGDEYFYDEEARSNWLRSQERNLHEYEKDLKKYKYENFNSVKKFYNNFWVSYEEYLDALRNGDCYSPFEHTQGDVSVFGIYFHS